MPQPQPPGLSAPAEDPLEMIIGRAAARVPAQVEGRDPSATIIAVCGPGALPVSIAVGPDWLRTVGVGGFATAVEQACRSASQARAVLWQQALAAEGWRAPTETTAVTPALPDLPGLEAPGPRAVDGPQPSSMWPAADPATSTNGSSANPDRQSATTRSRAALARPLSVLAAEALWTINNLVPKPMTPNGDQIAGGVTDGFAASVAGGNLVIRCGVTGDVSCAASIDWLSRRTADELTEAMNRALNQARADNPDIDRAGFSSAAAPLADTNPYGHVDGFITELLIALGDQPSVS